MPPVPMYPNNPMPNTDGHHRWWVWDGHEINLNEEDLNAYPKPVRAAVLAYRDAVTPEELDAAAYLVWVVEEHSPWSGGCSTCRTVEPCEYLRRGDEVAAEFLIRKSLELVARSKANIAHYDRNRGAA